MKILVIDDDGIIRRTLKALLERHGHDVTLAINGIEGIHFAERRPDLILCDVNMPGIDGHQVLEAIQHLRGLRETPFIFLSARGDRDAQRQAMNLGADDFIAKPFTEQEILDAIHARVRRQRSVQERVNELLAERDRHFGAQWSHELMTPLNGVLCGLEILETEAEKLKPAELKEMIHLIRVSAERQQLLARKVVTYYDLERRKQQPDRRTGRCPARSAVQNGALRVATAAGRVLDLSLACDAAMVPVEEVYLESAVAELVGNAFRFSLPGQKVAVTGARVQGRFRIDVIDQGIGMSAEQRAAIGAFRQFGREDHNQQGLGLGLAIARNVAELAGGRFLIDAGPGGTGLRTTIEMPTAQHAADPADAALAHLT